MITIPIADTIAYGLKMGGSQAFQYTLGCLNPMRDVGNYFAPNIEVFWRDTTPIQKKYGNIQWIQDCCNDLDLSRKIKILNCCTPQIKSFGGNYSFSKPILLIPPSLINEKGIINSDSDFSENEIKYLTIRELASMKSRSDPLNMVMKVSLVAFTIFLTFLPISYAVSCILLLSSMTIYSLLFQLRCIPNDKKAVQILSKHINNKKLAIETAISVYKKFQTKNLEYYQRSRLGKLFIDKNGDHRFNFYDASFTKRIASLQSLQDPLVENPTKS